MSQRTSRGGVVVRCSRYALRSGADENEVLMALERAQLLVESTSRPALQAFLLRWMEAIYALKKTSGLRWHLDVDPLEI